ncbi:MAG: hypothetical protein QXM75_01225 [Candidatus Diapherotrites archaeon]
MKSVVTYSGINRYLETYKLLEGLGYGLFCFFLPFVLSHTQHQIIVGTLVNAALIASAIRLDLRYTIPTILLPSLGVLSAGVLFGNLTPYLIYLVPFIWAGNAILVFSFKFFKDKGYIYRSVFSAIFKALFLGVSTFALVQFSVVPSAFLIPMSFIQLATALFGSALIYAIFKGLRLKF